MSPNRKLEVILFYTLNSTEFLLQFQTEDIHVAERVKKQWHDNRENTGIINALVGLI